jgi:hypothetical protein
MAGEAMNVRGPCSSCGAQLATDQRYCVECGQRVGPPLALPYALPASGTVVPDVAGGGKFALPMPLQTASIFAALALGFGVVVGTAISPNVGGILAAPAPTVVAQAPPPDTSTAATGAGGGGGGQSAPAASSTPVSTFASTGSGSGGGGGGGGGGKKKKQKQQPLTFTGTVVRANPVAQSYTIATSAGGLISIHADTLPNVGDQLESPVRKLKNGTYAEQGARKQTGMTDTSSFLGTVTYCADLEQPATPCDGSSSTDHYVYMVSSVGASVLVGVPHPAQGAPPKVGSQVQVGVHIGANFQQVTPSAWPPVDGTCAPPWDEQHGLPASPSATPELTQTSVATNAQGTNALLEAVVQTSCQGPPRLVLSADDNREAGRDLAALAIPGSIDPAKLTPGQAVQVALDVAPDGAFTLKGIASDQGTNGADDPAQGQGTLTGS